MSNLPKVLLIMAMSVLGSNAMADWQADAAHLSAEGIDSATAINALKSDLDKFMPPPPCIDKDPATFTLGTPATLACSGSSSSGSPSAPPSDSTIDEQKRSTGKVFDQMN